MSTINSLLSSSMRNYAERMSYNLKSKGLYYQEKKARMVNAISPVCLKIRTNKHQPKIITCHKTQTSSKKKRKKLNMKVGS